MIKCMSEVKTLSEVSQMSKISESNLIHNINRRKRKKNDDPEKLIAGVDYLLTRYGVEKYTPSGIYKITGGAACDF